MTQHETTVLRSRALTQQRSDSTQNRIVADLAERRRKEKERRQEREDKALAEQFAQATQNADTDLEEGERRFIADAQD